MFKIAALEKLVHELSRLPGIGPKSAQRLAYYVLRQKDFSDRLQGALKQVAAEVRYCQRCFSFTDAVEFCKLCEDPHRRNDQICVVEEPADILQLEASGAFRGRYHVLHGAISPLDGVHAEDLKIRELEMRIKEQVRSGQPPVEELILAFDPDLEGDTTSLYLGKLFAGSGLKISRIASGVPLGSDIDYLDDRTLGRALENRIEL